ncbi:MAG: hypothetical protein AABZ55_08695 [Bdellovibrionota bacterium]
MANAPFTERGYQPDKDGKITHRSKRELEKGALNGLSFGLSLRFITTVKNEAVSRISHTISSPWRPILKDDCIPAHFRSLVSQLVLYIMNISTPPILSKNVS